ncbi:MAG: ComEC/Rec2 family competence protein, partial [Anaerolineales bacterium]|nr:ComEC/Rec2 family competence protein [Anaerolineales bacterium]
MQTLPLLWLSTAFLCGILLGDLVGWSVTGWLSIAAGAALLQLAQRALRSRVLLPRLMQWLTRPPAWLPQVPFPATVLLAVLAFGAAWYAGSQPAITPQHIAWYNDQEISFVIEGTLESPADKREGYTNLRVEVEQIHAEDELLFTPVSGLLLVKAPGGEWRYGDRVRIQGYPKTPFESETFSYREYLERQGIYSMLICPEWAQNECVVLLRRGQANPLLAMIYALREHALETVHRLMPDPEAALLAGILLGIESGIPDDLQRAFQDTGTAHIIAISGFNFTLIAGLFVTLFSRWLGRWRGSLAALVSIAVYAALVGAGAGVIRAAIMSGVSLGAKQFGRRQHGLTSLSFTAAAMALFEPAVLWDVSFQLSFTATLGLILYAEPLGQAFIHFLVDDLHLASAGFAKKLSGPVGEYFLFTLAAQVTTLPVTMYHFQRLSASSLIANPLILPAQPPVMALGGLAVLLGSIYLPLGQAVAYFCWPFLAYTTRMVEWLASLRLGNLVLGQSSLFSVMLFYTLLLGWTFGGERLKTWLASRRDTPEASQTQMTLAKVIWPFLAGLAALTLVVWQAVFSRPDGRLHLSVLEVGSGDAILIKTPDGRNLLVDGGPSPTRLSDALGRRLSIFNRKLDYLIVVAASEEQIGALPDTLARFPPEQVLWSGPPSGTPSARKLQQWLAQESIPITTAQSGQALDLGRGARLHVLAASSHGAVLLLEWKNFRT